MTDPNFSPKTNSTVPRRHLPWLIVLFVGSGCAALIYEVVWLQLLQLVVGSSGISMGVLLGTYMGGMCLGSFLLPRLISARAHPLRVYAFLESGIGIIGLVVLTGMPLLAQIYAHYLGHGIVSRALIAMVCLIPPTLLMGATLPAIARSVDSTPEGVSWLGFFYGGNIAGAVFGCLISGFVLLRIYDLATTTYVAAAINFLVAAAAMVMASKIPHEITLAEASPSGARSAQGDASVYVVIALSGFCALGAEIVWTRLLSLMLGATVYTFSIILAAILFGLGIGSSWGASLAKSLRRPRLALGVCQIIAAVSAAWAALIISASLPFWPINPSLQTGAWSVWNTFQLDILRTIWTVLPSAIAWGASFPLALASVASRGQDPGRMVGGVYAANTIGAILGSLIFSMVLIPQAGTQSAQRLIILLSAVSAAIALAPLFAVLGRRQSVLVEGELRPVFGRAAAIWGMLALIGIGFLVKTVLPIPWQAVAWGRFSAAWASYAEPGIVKEADIPETSNVPDKRYCIYVGEGMNVSVAVTQTDAGIRYFHGAGKVQASSQAQDMRLQRMLGHLSALVRKDPDTAEDVLVVACGAGVTAGSFIPYPNIKRIVICDIEPLVPKVVTPMFGDVNYHIMDGIDKENPHMVNGKEVRVVYDDGRHYISTLPDNVKYDIITSDPIDPWVKGCAALNTIEYYKMCKAHLKPGGVMSLWIPLYESNDDTAKSLIGTFFDVFPNGMIFSNDERGTGYDAVLLGQVELTIVDVDKLQGLLNSESYRQVKDSLLNVGFGKENGNVAAQLLATYAGRAADLKEWSKDAQINTDRNLRLQFLAGLSLNSYVATEILNNILKHYQFPQDLFVGSVDSLNLVKRKLP
jgi:spermidine synthase